MHFIICGNPNFNIRNFKDIGKSGSLTKQKKLNKPYCTEVSNSNKNRNS